MKGYIKLSAFALFAFLLCIKCSEQVNNVQHNNQTSNKVDSLSKSVKRDTIAKISKQIGSNQQKNNQDKVNIHYDKLISLYTQLYECQTHKKELFKPDCLEFIQHIKDKKRIWNDNMIGVKKAMEKATLIDIMKAEKEVLDLLKSCERKRK
jgi:hypothetical protein